MSRTFFATTPWLVLAAGAGHTCPQSGAELAQKYDEIFPNGNRNAASFRWATYILDCASSLHHDVIVKLFTSFCSVSGSPLDEDSDANKWVYGAESGFGRLPRLDGKKAVPVALYHCCDPCVCDANEYLSVDTKTITDATGKQIEYSFVVMGDPCAKAPTTAQGQLDVKETDGESLADQAPDVVCGSNKRLEKATKSDNGGVILGMAHSATSGQGVRQASDPQVKQTCEERQQQGFESGMGLIFIDTAKINPLPSTPKLLASGSVMANAAHFHPKPPKTHKQSWDAVDGRLEA